MADTYTTGWLYKLGAKGLIKNWKKRFCILESGRIYYYTNSSPEQRATSLKGFIDLSTVIGIGRETTPANKPKGDSVRLVFEVRTPDRIWHLASESEAERTMWIEAIGMAVSILCKSRVTDGILNDAEFIQARTVKANGSASSPTANAKALLKSSSSRFRKLFVKEKEPEQATVIQRVATPPRPTPQLPQSQSPTQSTQSHTQLATQNQPQTQPQQPPPPQQQAQQTSPPEVRSRQASAATDTTHQSEPATGQIIAPTPIVVTAMAPVSLEAPAEQDNHENIEEIPVREERNDSFSEESVIIPGYDTRDEGANVPWAPIPVAADNNDDSIDISAEDSSEDELDHEPVRSERLTAVEIQKRISTRMIGMKLTPAFLLEAMNEGSAIGSSESGNSSDNNVVVPEEQAEPQPERGPSVPVQPTPIIPDIVIAPEYNVGSNDSLQQDMPPQSVTPPPAAVPPRPATPEPVSRRTKKAREIIQTEMYYLDCLHTMVVHYLVPLRFVIEEKSLDFQLTEDDVKSLFSTVLYDIVEVHSNLVKNLQERFDSWSDSDTRIADVIMDAARRFKSYIEYCANYDHAIVTYNRLCAKPSFSQLLLQFKLNSGVNLGLQHLLIMPVQRVPRYRLLLEELLRDTPNTHPDHDNIKQAIDCVEEVAVTINEGIRRRESMRAMQLHYEELADSHRFLIWDGFVDTRNASGKQSSKFAVFNDLLLSVSKQHIWLKPNPTAPNSWDIITPRKVYTIDQRLPEEMEFLGKLQSAMMKLLGINDTSKFPDKRRCRYVFSEMVTYDGEWHIGQMEGNGRMYFAQVGVYEGQFAQDERHGHGKMTWTNGATYEGHWERGKCSGKGVMHFPNGDRYEGNFLDGLRHGKGVMVYAGGAQYEGDWERDLPQGRGVFISALLGSYEGMWDSGKYHGMGKLVDSSGVTYQGDFHKGRKQGMGMYKLVAGNGRLESYIGHYRADLKHGEGKLTALDGSVYNGRWDAGMRHGKGEFTFSPEDILGRLTYIGEWNRDKMSGSGELIMKNGDRYIGTFSDGVLHGDNCRVVMKDGREYEGKFVYGAIDGAANLIYAGVPGAPPRAVPIAVIGNEMYQANKRIGPALLQSLQSSLVWPRLGAPVEPQLPNIELPNM